MIQESERLAVRRWDVVAGGIADWDKCVDLLECASANVAATSKEYSLINGWNSRNNRQLCLPVVPQQFSSSLDRITNKGWDCFDLNCKGGVDGERCKTALWEEDFRKALSTSTEQSLLHRLRSPTKRREEGGNGQQSGHLVVVNVDVVG